MSAIAIQVDQLGKAYEINGSAGRNRYRTLQEELLTLPRRIFQRESAFRKEVFWALKNISFEVLEGEVVGIIGRNGAGKSTLLKILSRITEPSSGQAELFGRVGSLLEVGTGFHPELTGRENVYLSGAILGMRHHEIQRRFDEIVDFAGVNQFIDTPVKRYSSGMYMRLAFAVAAHLDPEILVVDEVLAVGDVEFQKKCLNKMGDVAQSGRTVLFVSHNMAAVQQLCQRGIVLNHGEIVFNGTAAEAIQCYLQNMQSVQASGLNQRQDRQGNQSIRFIDVKICDAKGKELQQILSGQDLRIRFHYTAKQPLQGANIQLAFNVRNSDGFLISNLSTLDNGNEVMDIAHEGYFECFWPNFNLRSGIYDCSLYCTLNGDVADWLQSAFTLPVEDGDFYGTGRLPARSQGDVLINHTWSSYV